MSIKTLFLINWQPLEIVLNFKNAFNYPFCKFFNKTFFSTVRIYEINKKNNIYDDLHLISVKTFIHFFYLSNS